VTVGNDSRETELTGEGAEQRTAAIDRQLLSSRDEAERS
jgi:hypothetical protein